MPTPKAFDFRRDYPGLLGFIYATPRRIFGEMED